MTISTLVRKVIAAGDGVTTTFNFSFQVRSAADLQVYYTDANGVQTLLAANLYSVVLNAVPAGQLWSNGGSVTYPLTGSAIAAGTTLTIARNVSLLQSSSLINQGGYYPATVEQGLDLLTMEMQQVNESLGRTLTLPISSSASGALTTPVAGALIAVNSAGTGFTYSLTPTSVTTPLNVGNGGTGLTAGTAGAVLYFSTAAAMSDSAGFTFDGTSKISLGVAGASVGAVAFRNATSGSITMQPVAGALGAVTLSLPAATDTLVGKATTDTLTNKTLTNPANTTQALVDGANVAWDTSAGGVATLLATNAVGATRAMSAPTNIKTGGRYVLHFTQDATGGRALTFNAVFKNQAGASTIPAPAQGANARTSYVFDSPDGADLVLTNIKKLPTQTVLTSGTAATYTTPAGATRLVVRAQAAGGGSGGAGGAPVAGGTGGKTIFNGIEANGGTGGATSAAATGTTSAGGTAGTGTANVRINGSPSMGMQSVGATAAYNSGGGSSYLGWGAPLRSVAASTAGVAPVAGNYGAGASGAAGDLASFGGSVGGGGGEYFELIINNPAASYTYTIGAAGTAGTGTVAGALGTIGLIIVDEFYD